MEKNQLKLNFKQIEHNSVDYWKAVELRDKVLRKPLGLEFSEKELMEEHTQIHYAAFYQNELIACLSLVPLDHSRIKMRQVCTHPDFSGKGVGRQLAKFTEQKLSELGYKTIECNARKTAVSFYEKMNYKVISDVFYEVGIEHFKMEKSL
ncbi:MAG: GNAT family N-acetyltransferase [Chitinophagaceae bacterium]|nr:MAG: GNAT family N-acetyltransferase [Chitinophagaceae bacterium]